LIEVLHDVRNIQLAHTFIPRLSRPDGAHRRASEQPCRNSATGSSASGREEGREDSPYLGRKPAFTRAQFAAVRDMLGKGTTSIAQIAKATGVKRPTVYRLKADPAAAEAALATWGM
jgi:putative DNA-invertase from lambdoid prophage Rac